MKKQKKIKMTLAQYKATHEYFRRLFPGIMLPLEEAIALVKQSDEIEITDLEHENEQPA